MELVEFYHAIKIKGVKWKSENKFMQLIMKNPIKKVYFFFLLQLNNIIICGERSTDLIPTISLTTIINVLNF